MYTSTDKLQSHGSTSLTEVELLASLLDDMPNAEAVAQRVLDQFKSLSAIGTTDLSRLRMVEGMGVKRAKRLICAFELGRRCQRDVANPVERISSSKDVVSLFKPHMAALGHEECWVLYLNSTNRIVEQQRISQGGINTTVIDQRLVVKRALELLATQIVLVHNHPSGDVLPSREDISMTHRMIRALSLFDINLLDHIIISHSDEYSMLSGGDLKIDLAD